jgi:hypothetical protein
VKVAALVELPDVTGMEPAVAERHRGGGFVLPIARHDVVAPDQDLARSSGSGRWHVFAIQEFHLIVAQHTSHGMDEPGVRPVERLRRQVTGDGSFGQPVQHTDPVADDLERPLEDHGGNA